MLVGQGLFGGYPCCGTPGASIANSNILELMAGGEKDIPTSPEEALRERVVGGEYNLAASAQARSPGFLHEGSVSGGGSTGGGHGYGDVLERDPQAVVNDVRDEIVSDWAAHNVYRVAYDAETWTADEEKTRELRQHARSDRLCQARPYDEFEKEWLKRKPPEEMLAYYGAWPDARVVRPIIRI
jgi:acetophenone carboxylase